MTAGYQRSGGRKKKKEKKTDDWSCSITAFVGEQHAHCVYAQDL